MDKKELLKLTKDEITDIAIAENLEINNITQILNKGWSPKRKVDAIVKQLFGEDAVS